MAQQQSDLDFLNEQLNKSNENKFDELVELNCWSYKDLEYIAKRHNFQPNKINRLQFRIGEFLLVTSDGKPCFRCDGSLYPENIDHSLGHFHHVKCPKDSNQKIYPMR